MDTVAKKFILAAGLGLLVFTTGCFDTKEDFTINPDGSGKVVQECAFRAISLGNQNQDPETALTNAVREVLEQSRGVEAWRDVSYKLLDDGRFYFKGTAYFTNLSNLDIKNQTMLEFNWKKSANGRVLLTLRTNKSETHNGISFASQSRASGKLSPAELDKKIKRQRFEFQQSKPMLATMLGSMKQDVVFHLPGKVASHSNFTNDNAGHLEIKFSGAKLLAAMEKLVNDDQWCREHNGTGFSNMQQKPVMDAEINQLVFGQKAPVSATIETGTQPLFNYSAEVAKARKDYAKIKKQLAVGTSGDDSADDSPEISAAPAAGGLKNVKVVGVQLIRESDQKRDLRPFNFDAGYKISLLVDFPGAIQSVTDNTSLDAAIAGDGASLLPDSEWDRKVHFPKLAKDKTAALVEFKLKLPDSGVESLKELSGHVQYRVAGGTKEVDLGLEALKAGATGTNLDARIESIRDGWKKDGSQNMVLHLKATPNDIQSLYLVVNGQKTKLRQNGYGGGGGSYNITYESKQPFPPHGRLVAEIYDQIKTFDAPFKLQNLSLLGTPLK